MRGKIKKLMIMCYEIAQEATENTDTSSRMELRDKYAQVLFRVCLEKSDVIAPPSNWVATDQLIERLEKK